MQIAAIAIALVAQFVAVMLQRVKRLRRANHFIGERKGFEDELDHGDQRDCDLLRVGGAGDIEHVQRARVNLVLDDGVAYEKAASELAEQHALHVAVQFLGGEH